MALGKGKREQKELLPQTLVDHLLHAPLSSTLAPLTSGFQMLAFQKLFEQKMPLCPPQTSLPNVSAKVNRECSHAVNICICRDRCICICMYMYRCVRVLYSHRMHYLFMCSKAWMATHSETPVCRQSGGSSQAFRGDFFLKGWPSR